MTNDAPQPTRQPTPIDGIAEEWVTTLIDLIPRSASTSASGEPTGRVSDTSPAGTRRWPPRAAPSSRSSSTAEPVDDVDRVTKTDLLSELELDAEAHAANLHAARPERHRVAGAGAARGVRPHADRHRPTTGASSPSVSATSAGASTATSRPCAPASPRAWSLRGVRSSRSPPRRASTPTRSASSSTSPALPRWRTADPARLARRPTSQKGARASAEAYAELAEFLETELAPKAGDEDAVGREVYALQLAPLPRRGDRPRRDLRVGHRGAASHGRRADADRGRDQGRARPSQEAIAFLDGDDGAQAARHGRAAGVDAGAPATRP